MANKYDVIVIGGGPNGLTASAYLAKAGLKVCILDRKCEMGGGAATEELAHPNLLSNAHAIFMMMTDYAPPYKDLELEEKYDLKHIYPQLQWAMPLSDGRCICLYSDVEKSCSSIAKFSEKDASSYREVSALSKSAVEEFLAPATYAPAVGALDQAARLEKSEIGKTIMEFSEKSPRAIIEDLFENDHVRCLMLYLVCMWGLDPEVEGIGYLPLLYINRSINYKLSVGGTHRLPQTLIKSILENKGVLRGSIRINKIIVEENEAKGVELDDGSILEADVILSTIDPHQTFLKYIGTDRLDEELKEQVENYRWEWESLLQHHLALTEAPDFTAAKDNPEINNSLAYLLGYETEENLLKDFECIKNGELSDLVAFNCLFPTVHDPSLIIRNGGPSWKASFSQDIIEPQQTGLVKHGAYISRLVPYDLKEGGVERWYSYSFKQELCNRAIETLHKYAPNMTDDTILTNFTATPLDHENKFPDMVKGSIKQGEYHPLQMGYLRPNMLCSQHETPIKNLYLGGASTHSGGTILLGPGYLAANRIADNLGIKKWWKEPEMVTAAREKGLLP